MMSQVFAHPGCFIETDGIAAVENETGWII